MLGGLLVAVGLASGCRDTTERSSQAASTRHEPPPTTTTASATFEIEGMACEQCAARLDDVVTELPSVVAVTVDFPTERMRVDYDAREVDVARIVVEVEQAGFEANEVKP